MRSILLILLFSFCQILTFAQDDPIATITGTVTDKDGSPLIGANIFVDDVSMQIGVQADEQGRYTILIPANTLITLSYTYIGYKKHSIAGIKLPKGKINKIDIALEESNYSALNREIVVTSFKEKEVDGLVIEAADIAQIPTPGMNLEQMLTYLAPGVNSGTGGELTSQYSVRGGNYDENLIYVNDFEIYRPLLIRSGQQEGLTFPNPAMLRDLSFSAGGFKAQYGDKMSSVLDVRYRRPYNFESSVSASLLGASAYVGGALYRDSTARANKSAYRHTFTLGARYKTTRYLLSSLDVKGEYIPDFVDIQGNFIFDFGRKFQLEFLGNYSNSIFSLSPDTISSTTGLFNRALRFDAAFDGRELDNFETFMTGTALTYLPYGMSGITVEDSLHQITTNLRLKLMASHYQSKENERIDIIGFYRLSEIETGLGDDDFGEVIGTLAYGETHHFARNYLQSNVTNIQLKGTWTHEKFNTENANTSSNWLRWGVRYKNELIDDQLNEWRHYDSMGYTLPFDTTQLLMPDYINSQVNLNTHRLTAYVQNTWEKRTAKHLWRITGGVRAHWANTNNELFISPRAQIYYTPRKFSNPLADTTTKTKDLTFKLAVGSYYQPPFYREMRNLRGELNTNVRAQKSIQGLAGIVWDFMLFNRKFKFITEAYYKHQWDMVPYDVENVRIHYYGDNLAKGYVTGLDLRLNGELVKGLESWINFSLMRARESFLDVEHGKREFINGAIDTTWLSSVRKPTDQMALLSMYFQDNLPKIPWCRVNLALTVGTGFPFGVPNDNIEFRNTYSFSPYHRIDMGFSFFFWNRDEHIAKKWEGNKMKFKKSSRHALRKLRNMWLSVEVFNLMQVANTASNNWVKDFSNRSYAIPNTLTSRRINVRFRVDF